MTKEKEESELVKMSARGTKPFEESEDENEDQRQLYNSEPQQSSKEPQTKIIFRAGSNEMSPPPAPKGTKAVSLSPKSSSQIWV